MYRYFFILTLFIYSNWTILQAEENIERINACYLIPQIPHEYLTQGNICVIENCQWHFAEKYREKNHLSFSFIEENTHYDFNFATPFYQLFEVGVYKHATSWPFQSEDKPRIDLGIGSRRHNRTDGEFEVLEVQYDLNGNLLCFAADFSIFSNPSEQEVFLRGSIRFNSTIPVSPYFVKMVSPEFAWTSEQLIYVVKSETSDETVLIAEDRSKIEHYTDQYTTHVAQTGVKFPYDKISFVERDNLEISLFVSDLKWPCDYKGIVLRLNSNFLKKNLFYQNKFHFKTDMDEDCQLSLVFSNRDTICSEKGEYVLHELAIDPQTNQLDTLAIDFDFKDEFGQPYKGCIRYHSQIPVRVCEFVNKSKPYSYDDESFSFIEESADFFVDESAY